MYHLVFTANRAVDSGT